MTQQKSEGRVLPQGRRKAASTRGVERPGGGKAVPVKQASRQLALPFATAEYRADSSARATGRAETGVPSSATAEASKAKIIAREATAATMEELVEQLEVAFHEVASNKGAPGPDRQSIDDVREHLDEILPALRRDLLSGSYRPGMIRRVWIPKGGGGQRGLGIPNVIDRMVQEATSSGARAPVRAVVPSEQSRVPSRPELPHGTHRGRAVSANGLRAGGGS